MANSYYNHTTYPAPNSPGASAALRAELTAITAGFALLPTLTGNGYKVAMVNAGGTALIASSALQSLAITGSTVDGTPIGATTRAAGNFTTLSVNSTANLGSSVTIAGGTINGTQIGNTTPSSGAFTTLSASSGLTGNVTGNLTGNVTGNVTGNLTGNVTGNVTATSGTSQFNNVTINGQLDMDAGSSATIINLPNPTNNGDAANKAYVDTQDALRLALAGGTMSGAIAMGTNRITGLGDPVNAQDAATKIYVDNAVQGLDAKASARVATTGNITLSGTQTIDGVAVIAGDRVLVKDQSSAAENGIYVAASGAWSRAADANTWDELVHAFVFVESGTAGANNGYVCTVSAGGTLGTTAVTWVQFSGAGQITAGTGMTKSGNTLNVNTASSSRIVVGADEIDLATTGVVAGTYRSVTVDQWGRVTGGTTPTTLAGYGITDAYTSSATDTLLNAKLSLSGGTMSGNLAMGSNRITGMADPTSNQDAATKFYVDSILGSATSAAASASAAATSALNASNSATSASNSANAAANSASAAATSYDEFDDRYLGSKTSNPTTDNDGNALLTGALYWNSVAGEMRVYSGTAWQAAYLPAAGYLPISGGALTGDVTLNAQNDLRFADADSSNWVAFQAPATVASNVTWTLPAADGTANQVLSTNGSGTLSWSTIASSQWTTSGSDISYTTGRVSIGTASPAYGPLHVHQNSTNNTYIQLSNNSTGATSSDGVSLIVGGAGEAGNTDFIIQQREAAAVAVFTSSLRRFTINSSGAFGLGPTPSYGTSGQALLSAGSSAVPTWGDVVTPTGTQTLTNKTLTTPVLSATAAGTTAGQLGYSGGVFTFGNGSATRTVVTLEDTQTVSGAKTFSAANTFTAAQTFRAANAIRSEAASTQDAVVIAGRAGGTGSWAVTLTPATLSANRTLTLPDAAGTAVLDTATQTLTNKTIEAGTFTNGYTEETVTANTGTAYTIDLANGTVQLLTLTGNCTFTFPTATAGRSFILHLRQDGTGSRTATWPAAVKWPASTAPTLTSTANRMDRFVFTADGTNWVGSVAGQNYTV